jgi:hypothetical protein
VKEHQVQIHARIMKLRKEEERANRRIKDLDRRQKFVSDMHSVKNDRINMINNMYNNKKFVEVSNRDKFNQIRDTSKNNIQKNLKSVHHRNLSDVNSIKDQTK